MLKKMIVENFMSFREKTEFNFERSNYKFLEETNTFNSVTKGSFFIGGNASGKSNCILAIELLLEMMFKNGSVPWNIFICRFSTVSEATLYYEFIIENKIIKYSISWSIDGNIKNEKLILDEKEVMSRSSNEAIYRENNSYKFTTFDNLVSNACFLRDIYFNTSFRDYPILQKWFEFLKNSISINARYKVISSYNKEFNAVLDEYLCDNGEKEINTILPMLLNDVQIQYDSKCEGVGYSYNSETRQVFIRRNRVNVAFHLFEESEGTQNLINLLPALIKVVEKGGMLIIDEFSSAFHNFLERKFVRYFYDNSNNSQLFLVTHSTNLLSSEILRPDQVFTFNFKDDTGSKVIKVSEYAKPRAAQNFEKMYLNGMFEGIPLDE